MIKLLACLAGLIMCVAGAHAQDRQVMQLAQTIPLDNVQGRIDHMATDAEGKRLYVAALGNDSMEVIDLAAGKRIESIGGLKKPTGVRVLPQSGTVVVASGDDGKVRLYDAGLNLLGTIGDLD